MPSPRESGSMSMDVDDGASSCYRPHRHDSVEMSAPTSSAGRTSFDMHYQTHGPIQTPMDTPYGRQQPDHEGHADLDGSRLLMELASSSSAMDLGQMDTHQNHALATQHEAILSDSKPSVQDTEVAPRKRKHFHDLPRTDTTDRHDILYDNASAPTRPRRRTRPRLRRYQDGEFSPLLIMSPSTDSVPSLDEESISMFHFPPNPTDASHPIQRYFHPDAQHGPRILPHATSELSPVDDPLPRTSSTDSFTQVALATTRAQGRLSTLSDIYLPRPFDDPERPSLGSIKVHERGVDAPPAFLSGSGSGGRTGGPRAGAPGRSIRPHGSEPEASTVRRILLDKPLCESPDSISPVSDDGQ